ncbi:MAG TPA: urea ABC transporter permease subunit UrtC, partial [Collimonas sp.]|nr:urea ABC transporter permease subunit UrtC [Collimonas sp.]
IWAAVGGRGSLVGPIIGAFSVNGLKSWFTGAFPDLWLYALGLIFILVTLFMPQGILGLASNLKNKLKSKPERQSEPEASSKEAT